MVKAKAFTPTTLVQSTCRVEAQGAMPTSFLSLFSVVPGTAAFTCSTGMTQQHFIVGGDIVPAG